MDILMVARTADVRKALPNLDPFALGAIESECPLCHEPVLIAKESQPRLMAGDRLECNHCWSGRAEVVVDIDGPTGQAVLAELAKQ